jgi:cytochrome P450
MSSPLATRPGTRTFRLYRNLPRILRDPMREIEQIGRLSSGELVRIDFGIVRAYVATHPDHVQHILLENSANFLRDGTFWRPLHRLFGDGIMSEGADWKISRKILQPVMTRRHVVSVADDMAGAINEAIESLAEPARTGETIQVLPEMTAIVNHTVLRVFFGDKISASESGRLSPAFERIVGAIAFRFLLPFLPESVPVPGDRALKKAVREIDEVLFHLVRKNREHDDGARDFFSVLCRSHEAMGGEVTDRWIRDNLFAMFATATETTIGALTWLWPLLDTHPEVTAKLYEEIDRVLGGGPVAAEHLNDLAYTRQVVQELLRLYPVGWLFPRRAAAPATLGDVPIKPGETVLVSPFLTHRLESFWERPLHFDPDRFSPGRQTKGLQHRYAYFPFGAGPHKCIGMHVFNVEAELIIAAILSRFRPVRCTEIPASPRIGATLRPRLNVEMTLRPA